jgi:hypothetical protein
MCHAYVVIIIIINCSVICLAHLGTLLMLSPILRLDLLILLCSSKYHTIKIFMLIYVDCIVYSNARAHS